MNVVFMHTIDVGTVIDGYRLIRIIGSGGFGDVWLCFSETLQQYFACKVIRGDHPDHGDKELAAVQTFKRLSLGGLDAGVMPVEHVGKCNGLLYYIMPLADGTVESPESPTWEPVTLGSRIRGQRAAAQWFSTSEIIEWFLPVIRAAEAINNVGLVHRDIKPDNILFIKDRAVLSDISLLRSDAEIVTGVGTPGYRAPSWYIESGGKPDMFGLASTLYTALTGNDPDKIGRANFRWPPQGEASLTEEERRLWLRLHQVVFRATAEKAADRFLSFTAMADGLAGSAGNASYAIPESTGGGSSKKAVYISIAAVTVLLAVAGIWASNSDSGVVAGAELSAEVPLGEASPIGAEKQLWEQYDAAIAALALKMNGYQEQWSNLQHSSNELLGGLNQGPVTLERLGALANEIKPLSDKAKALKVALDELRGELWNGNAQELYSNAIEHDKTPQSWKTAKRGESEVNRLRAAWGNVMRDIGRAPMDWNQKLSVQLALTESKMRAPLLASAVSERDEKLQRLADEAAAIRRVIDSI